MADQVRNMCGFIWRCVRSIPELLISFIQLFYSKDCVLWRIQVIGMNFIGVVIFYIYCHVSYGLPDSSLMMKFLFYCIISFFVVFCTDFARYYVLDRKNKRIIYDSSSPRIISMSGPRAPTIYNVPSANIEEASGSMMSIHPLEQSPKTPKMRKIKKPAITVPRKSKRIEAQSSGSTTPISGPPSANPVEAPPSGSGAFPVGQLKGSPARPGKRNKK